MAWFGKSNDVVDLTQKYQKDPKKIQTTKSEQIDAKSETPSTAGFGFFNAIAHTTSKNNSDSLEKNDLSESEEKKRKLAKRLSDMADKIEELSNQIYLLQQRTEVLEKKSDLNKFD